MGSVPDQINLDIGETGFDLWGFIAEHAGQGAQGVGQLSDILINAGLNVGAIADLLGNASDNAQATPQQIAYLQQELAFLHQQQQQQQTSTLTKVVIGGGLAYLLYRAFKSS